MSAWEHVNGNSSQPPASADSRTTYGFKVLLLQGQVRLPNSMLRATLFDTPPQVVTGSPHWSFFLGHCSDTIGRRLAFKFTLFLAGAFGLAAAGGPNRIGTCALYACVGLGWPVGQSIGSLNAWSFIPNTRLTGKAILRTHHRCDHVPHVPPPMLPFPPVRIAKTWLTEDVLNAMDGHPQDALKEQKLSVMAIIKRQLGKFGPECIAPLFSGWRLSINALLLWLMWTTIGLRYPLFNDFLPQDLPAAGVQSVPENTTHPDYAITSVVGVPGSILACYTVDLIYIGRKGPMAISYGVTTSSYQLTISSLEACFQNIMYRALYAYSPGVFPAPPRST
ncbi:hypothetical protein DOTSEDRAFT_30273 [Dothistroma septosporum NZE10]|uniref:Major facilitator superfamily (MFS) profile domain-containing protein n=1 Tax=Dothistroma septosporum (strain NZE10 / CBS 128990) TaxID=675120 RepID=N1PZQ5_DOTSN|nr:hypothetical protein DOTSEDRAFT_30273 [Dothistroma septosporum NZE10]